MSYRRGIRRFDSGVISNSGVLADSIVIRMEICYNHYKHVLYRYRIGGGHCGKIPDNR